MRNPGDVAQRGTQQGTHHGEHEGAHQGRHHGAHRAESHEAGRGFVPDDAELAARLRLAVGRLSRRIRQQVAGEASQSQVSVLTSVERLGRPTLGELAASEQVQPPSMTRQVDALEARGLVARTVDPDDRRVGRVELTSAGRRVLARSRSLRTAYLVRTIARLPIEERDQLGELVSLLEHIADLA